MRGLSVFFASVEDVRARNVRHALGDILLIAFAATLCGVDTCTDMAEFGYAKQDVLSTVMPLEHGTPSHDTFSRVFRLLDPTAFGAAFRDFMQAFAAALAAQHGPAGQIVAIDGKSLRGAIDHTRPTSPLHLVTAWAAEQRLVLGQVLAPGRAEAHAAREVIGLLDLTGCIVTADALHCSRQTAAAIRKRGGNYALVIKGNRGPLHREAMALMDQTQPEHAAVTTETGHGRHEERRAWVVPVPDWAGRHGFPDLAAIARIDCLRRSGTVEQRKTRYVALSTTLNPAEALRVIRAHWSIENQQHWLLDVVWGEDRASTRHDNTAQNLALLRRLALSLIKTDLEKGSMRLKTKRAAWRNDYLAKLLSQMQ